MVNERKTILVADDDEGVRELLLGFFEMDLSDYDLEVFEDGTSLVERLDKGLNGVYAVVTDNEMPGRNGSDIIKDYASKNPDTMFVLCYGGGERIGKEAVENGARAYFLKPYNTREVTNLLRGER